TQPFCGRLGEREPIVPVAKSVLYALDLSDELRAFWRLRGEFSGIARSLTQKSILMHQLLGGEAICFRNGLQDPSRHRQRIAVHVRMKILAGTLQSLLGFAASLSGQSLAQFLFPLPTKLNKLVHQLSLATWFLGELQAPEGRELHIEITHFPGFPSNTGEELQQSFLVAVAGRTQLFEQRLQTAHPGAEAVNSLCFRLSGKPIEVSFQLLEDKPAAFWRNPHKSSRKGELKDTGS